jgi:hypothetical protein
MMPLLRRVARVANKSPGYIAQRLLLEARNELDRFTLPRQVRSFDVKGLLARTRVATLDDLWAQLASQLWPIPTRRVVPESLEAIRSGAVQELLARGERGCRHEVNLLGSGPTMLGAWIEWSTDFKTGDRWQPGFFRDIPIIDQTRPSDVKVPWELSRVQWLIPVGQAFLLTGDQRYARSARDVLEQWIAANPVAGTVNWSIAMEPALRVFVWIWLFRTFALTPAWADPTFRARFLCALYQHAAFVDRYIEAADVNGNHFTADCAALVAAGAFWPGPEAKRWLMRGWQYLEREIRLQILDDGVDFEASAAYHRLVGELFLHGAIYATASGLTMSAAYRQRLAGVARFVVAYTRPDGAAPLWGDADDARVLPLGVAPVTEHQHLVTTIAAFLGDADLASSVSGGHDEAWWLLGYSPLNAPRQGRRPDMLAFDRGGAYILRAVNGYVFIDCGSVGLAGRGGHGHNDALSFEAMLDGVSVVSDAGCFVYTASFALRNEFRATAAHNTPQVDGAELNRLDPNALWTLQDDAQPRAAAIRSTSAGPEFVGAHTGYLRLPAPVVPTRRIVLRSDGCALTVEDRFDGTGRHEFRIPLQLAPGWTVRLLDARQAMLTNETGRELRVSSRAVGEWVLAAGEGRVAPSYGVVRRASRLEWRAVGEPLALALTVEVELARGS